MPISAANSFGTRDTLNVGAQVFEIHLHPFDDAVEFRDIAGAAVVRGHREDS